LETIRGAEFSVVVHFTTAITGPNIELIYSRCKSKLIIVCDVKVIPRKFQPENKQTERDEVQIIEIYKGNFSYFL
jgi:hypothetical protein